MNRVFPLRFCFIGLNTSKDLRTLDVCLAMNTRGDNGVLITHKYKGSHQFSRVGYSTQIYRFDTRGAKGYWKVLAAELSIQPNLEINYLQQRDQ